MSSAGLEMVSLHVIPSAPCSPTPFDKDKAIKEYQACLQKVRRLARVSTAIFSLNWFLGVCALTWATAVILGGLLPQLGGKDFYCVSALLLLWALCLAAATFFGNLVTRKLIYKSTLPADITYDDKDRYWILESARVLDLTFQLLVLAISCFLSLKRLSSLPRQSSSDLDGLQHSPSPAPSQQPSPGFDGQYHALYIFYVLVFFNAFVAVVGALVSKIVVPWFTTSFSLRRYYDHIVWRGMEKGFLYSTDFDFPAFAFKALADEYRRNLRASVVYKLYSDLIHYLYAHNRGFDAARIAMDSNDHCEQEAAANIVGLWAQLEGAGPSLLLQSRLLTKLADALDHQETGRAATCSFESLAKFLVNSGVEGQLLEVTNARNERLMEILCNCVSNAVKVKKHDKALVFIKVLIQLLKSVAGQQERQRQGKSKSIVDDLKSVFKEKGCKRRTVGVAGKALQMMDAGMSSEEVDEYLRFSPPSGKEHILEDEKEYVQELLKEKELPLKWGPAVDARSDTWPQESPSYANRRIRSTVLAFVVVIVEVAAVILGLYLIQF